MALRQYSNKKYPIFFFPWQTDKIMKANLSPLTLACQMNNLIWVRELFEKNMADVCTRNSNGLYPEEALKVSTEIRQLIQRMRQEMLSFKRAKIEDDCEDSEIEDGEVVEEENVIH